MTKHETAKTLWIVTGYLGCLLIITLSLVPAAAKPHSGIGSGYEHWLAYALVGLAFGMGYRTIRRLLFSGLALTAGAGILELLQAFVPGRDPETIDFVASSLGAWFGLALSIVAQALLRVKAKLSQYAPQSWRSWENWSKNLP